MSFGKNDFQIVKEEKLYQGVFRLMRYHLRHRLFDGTWSTIFTRELLERASAAAVLPYDPVLDNVILIQQFRPGCIRDAVSPWLIEIPAGIIVNETPEEVAMHEAFEEAGCQISNLHSICEYYVSPGGSDEYLTLYCGKVDAANIKGVFGLAEENENIQVMNIPRTQAMEYLRENKIKTSPALLSLLWLESNRPMLLEKWEP